jgi:hypothetical protein
VRVVGEVKTRLGVGGAAAGVDPERTDFPVGWNRTDQEEDQDQAEEEQEESKPPAPAAILVALGTPRWESHLRPP